MVSRYATERMKTALALVSPPLILIIAAGISLKSFPAQSNAPSPAVQGKPVSESIFAANKVPSTPSESKAFLNNWDDALAWWWKKDNPIPWNKHCAETSRDAYRTGWYPLACFMIPVERIQNNLSGKLSLGETPIYEIENIRHSNDKVTSDITVLDCRKGNGCKPKRLHDMTMSSADWNVISQLTKTVHDGIPEEDAVTTIP